jgi:hypothetical protein
MEELYTQVGQPINTISADISRKLESVGIKTAHHVSDYLDPKYKREKAPAYNLVEGSQNPDRGIIEAKNLLDVMHKINGNIDQLTREEAQPFYDLSKRIESAAKTVEQYCDTKGWALLKDDSSLQNKKYEKVTTELPDPSRGVAWNAWNMYVMPEIERFYNTHKEIHKAIEKLPPEEDRDQEMADAFQIYGAEMFKPLNDFNAPFKDLKYATTVKNWWRTVIRYFDHGKHAAGVMDAINSHKYLEEKEIPTNAINCLHTGCPYFVTLPDVAENQERNVQPQLELLLTHLRERHDYQIPADETLEESLGRLAPQCAIVKQNITVQVPKERDLTREQVGDKIKELVELAIKFVPAIKAFQVLCAWREETADGRVATRRMDAHPKLSDLA